MSLVVATMSPRAWSLTLGATPIDISQILRMPSQRSPEQRRIFFDACQRTDPLEVLPQVPSTLLHHALVAGHALQQVRNRRAVLVGALSTSDSGSNRLTTSR